MSLCKKDEESHMLVLLMTGKNSKVTWRMQWTAQIKVDFKSNSENDCEHTCNDFFDFYLTSCW